MASTTSWFTWVQLECYSTIHNLPYASKADGFEGWDAVLEFNSPAHVKHLERLLALAKEGAFKYSGRDNAPDPIFRAGKTAIGFGSSADRGTIAREAQFKWAAAVLPYDPQIIKSPNNTIIGGASLWTMTAPKRTEAEYKAVATLLEYIGQPANDAMYHQHTGYVPVTLAGYELSKQQGYYDKNPGADIAIKSLTRGTVTANSKGLRLGNLPEIRNIIYEEVEKALQGQQTAKGALDNAVTRGNVVLRNFQKTAKG
jgi:sn-glycerol 3-phosphate transport system substrate-binding protein